ncbi:glycosyltransferase family 2 protein [Rhodococcus sp. CH91]|uniref:glycosyltransferase family 2 protein n=1 Tax=Rhodococcus sp. CH91 TaxID=2910256 RepID=UPI0035A91797
MESTITVVIPTLERSELYRALESVRAQTLPCHEVLVIVDKPEVSPDTRRFLRENERAISTGGGRGGAVARNIGLAHATGQYVAFLDDDDWWEPEKIESQVDACNRTGATVSWTATRFHQDSKVRIIPRRPYQGGEFVGDYLVARPGIRHGDGYIQSSSLLIDRQLATKVQWDESLKKHQDWDFVIRLVDVECSRFTYVPLPLVNVQQASENSVSASRKWAASAHFLLKFDARWGQRAKADFVLTQIVRSSLAAGDIEGLRSAVRLHPRALPNFGAILVAGMGMFEFFKLQTARWQRRSEKSRDAS